MLSRSTATDERRRDRPVSGSCTGTAAASTVPGPASSPERMRSSTCAALSVGTWPWTSGTRARLRTSRARAPHGARGRDAGLPADSRPRTFVAISARTAMSALTPSPRPRTRHSRTRSWVGCAGTGRRPRHPRRTWASAWSSPARASVIAPRRPRARSAGTARCGCSSAGGSGPVVSGSAGSTSPTGSPRCAWCWRTRPIAGPDQRRGADAPAADRGRPGARSSPASTDSCCRRRPSPSSWSWAARPTWCSAVAACRRRAWPAAGMTFTWPDFESAARDALR